MLDVLWAIPLAKIIYSIILFGLAVMLLREVYTIWADRNIYVGNFAYFVDGRSDDEQSKKFPVNVLAQHHMLRSALIDELHRREEGQKENVAGTPEVYRHFLPSFTDVTQWKSAISDLELKVQGFDIGRLLSQLRAWVTPPTEITGYVEKIGGVIRASVSIPPGVVSGDSDATASRFETGPLSSDSSTALAIAANIAWLQAARHDPKFVEVGRDTFVA